MVLATALLVTSLHGCSNDNLPDLDAGRRNDAPATGGTGGNDGRDADGLADVGDASAGAGGAIPPIGTGEDARVIDVACVDAGAPPDPRYEWPSTHRPRACCDFFVELPPEGTQASVESICGDVSAGTAASGWAAHATLTGSPMFSTAGTIDVGRALADRVVGVPTIAMIDASPTEWRNAVLTQVRTKAFGGYEFDVSWSNVPAFGQGARMTLEVTFLVRCDDDAGPLTDGAGSSRTVKALTNFVLCGFSLSASGWVPSGGICSVCGVNGGEIVGSDRAASK